MLMAFCSEDLDSDSGEHVVSYLISYAEANAILLLGRIPGYKRSDIQLLPCSTTKSKCGWDIVHVVGPLSLHCQSTLLLTPHSAASGSRFFLTSSSQTDE